MSDPKYRTTPTPSGKPASDSTRPHNQPASASKPAAARRAQPAETPINPADGDSKQSGRVAFDSRGNPIWEWQTSTGVFDKNVTTQRLKKLEAPELSIADTQPVPKPKGLSVNEPTRATGGGFNPYDSGAPAPKAAPKNKQAAHPALVHKQAPPVKRAEPAKPESTWQRLKSKFSD